MDVGVRELKQNLSSYLDRAASGERILVTDRGRPRALIVPLPGGDNLQRGIEEGWITPPPVAGDLPAAPTRATARARTEDVVAEDRDD